MNLNVENFALIKKANLEIKGLTVIGAENDTGKSTLGKILYNIFSWGEHYNEHYSRITRINLNRLFRRIKTIISNEFYSLENERLPFLEININKSQAKRYAIYSEFKDNIYDAVDNFFYKNEKINVRIIKDFKFKFLEKDKNTFTTNEKEELKVRIELLEEVLEKLNSKELFYFRYINSYFNEEYSSGIQNFFSDNTFSKIEFNDNLQNLALSFNKNEIYKMSSNILEKTTNVIYIESPLCLDSKSSYENIFRKELKEKLEKKLGPLEQIFISDKKKEAIARVKSVISGNLSYDSENDEYIFKRNNKEIKMNLLASGIKSFGILELLLENGYLIDETILIIDEPEVHLHPKWQIKYAEILCILIKEMDVNVLLNSHSPYFIEALSVYSKKYKIADKTNFYTFEKEKDGNTLYNKNENLGDIYDKLLEPYQILRKEEFSKESRKEELGGIFD